MIIELSKTAYAEIEEKLKEVRCEGAIIDGLIDMHGLLIKRKEE